MQQANLGYPGSAADGISISHAAYRPQLLQNPGVIALVLRVHRDQRRQAQRAPLPGCAAASSDSKIRFGHELRHPLSGGDDLNACNPLSCLMHAAGMRVCGSQDKRGRRRLCSELTHRVQHLQRLVRRIHPPEIDQHASQLLAHTDGELLELRSQQCVTGADKNPRVDADQTRITRLWRVMQIGIE